MKSQRPHLMESSGGLLPENNWLHFFSNYPADSIRQLILLRIDLAKRIPAITEKVNGKTHYFGYRLGQSAQRLYIYVQRKKIVVDINIDKNQVEKLGYKVTCRNNFQRRAGWPTTGWEIPYEKLSEDQERKRILDVMSQVFQY